MEEEIRDLSLTLNNLVEGFVALEDEVARLNKEVECLMTALEQYKKSTAPEERGLWCETVTWTDN